MDLVNNEGGFPARRDSTYIHGESSEAQLIFEHTLKLLCTQMIIKGGRAKERIKHPESSREVKHVCVRQGSVYSD
jgi:hypothetical protein